MKNFYLATLAVIATSLGTAILVLPMTLATTGFILSIFLLLSIWAIMSYTSLLFLEITLWFPPGTNYMTMGIKILGRGIAVILWCLYLLLMYLLLSAYLTSICNMIINLLSDYPHLHQYAPWILVGVGLLGVLIIYSLKIRMYYLTAIVVLLFLGSFALFTTLMTTHLQAVFLTGGSFKFMLIAVPFILTAFSYQYIIPQIRDGVVGEQFKTARRIIFFGGLFLLLVYLVWVTIIFGFFPLDRAHGFSSIFLVNHPSSVLIDQVQWLTGNSFLANCCRFLCFFAVGASFLSIAHNVYHFAENSFSIKQNVPGKIGLLIFTFLPPICYIFLFPKKLVFAFNTAGILVTLLYIIVPALMVWIARYIKCFAFGYRVKGGCVGLLVVLLIGCGIMYSELRTVVSYF